jgi:hypothetical protein
MHIAWNLEFWPYLFHFLNEMEYSFHLNIAWNSVVLIW